MLRRIVTAFLACAALGQAAQASPFDIYGAEPEAMGMAGAYSTLANRGSGAYYNPGAMGFLQDEDVQFGIMGQTQDLKFNGREKALDQTSGWSLAFSNKLGILGRKFGVSTLFFIPSDRVIRITSREVSDPRFQFYDNYPNRLGLYFALGHELIEDVLSVGAGFQIMADISGGIDVNFAFLAVDDRDQYQNGDPCEISNNPDCQLVPGDAPESAYVKTHFDETLKLKAFPNAGLLLKPIKQARVALVYRSKFQQRVRIPESFDLTVPFLGKIPVGVQVNLDSFYQPSAAVLGMSYSPDYEASSDTWTASLDITHQRFSEYKTDELDLQMRNTQELEDRFSFGLLQHKRVDAGFKDVISYRAGFMHKPSEYCRYMLGYAYLPTPIPNQTGRSNFLDSDRHMATGGLGFNLGFASDELKRMDIVLAGQMHFLTSRSWSKRSPAHNIGRQVALPEVQLPDVATLADLYVVDPGNPRGKFSGWVGAATLGIRYLIE